MDPFTSKESYLINPPFFWTDNYENEVGEKRRARQHGKFFIQSLDNSIIPLEKQKENSNYLEKYCIPKEAKIKIRKELAKRGICAEFLYPELDPKVQKEIEKIRRKHLK